MKWWKRKISDFVISAFYKCTICTQRWDESFKRGEQPPPTSGVGCPNCGSMKTGHTHSMPWRVFNANPS